MEFTGKVALITGAGSGIGRACALALSEGGAQIVVSDINTAGGEETVNLIRAAGGDTIFIETNVIDAAQVQRMVEFTVDTYGQLDIAVNNAGVGGSMLLTDQLDEPTWEQVINVNLKGVWLCMKYEIPAMLTQKGGAIINVSSLAGLVGFPYNAVYSASKHGVIGLTKSAALEYARRGLRVNAICPGFTETPMVTEMIDLAPSMSERTRQSSPMRRLGTVEEIASAVVFLAGSSASFVNGVALPLDGGAVAQ
ncbi:MAG: SDR family oxidoreductase [Anaerolineae bacterium]